MENIKALPLIKRNFVKAFHPRKPERIVMPHLAVCSDARMGNELFEMTQKMPCRYPVVNETCVNNRSVGETAPPGSRSGL